ncbi:MAG: cytidylyltransferase domain-containing protein [Treponema sp.]
MKTVVIVQCRLSSTRLPRKALYELDGKPLLQWALESMKQVRADDFFVACDFESEEELAPVVLKSGFKIFAGPKDDVLQRFCSLIEKENPDIVVRATADNPFLFYEAANELLELYKTEYFGKIDYITFSGLPHGSGIEIFNARSLVTAAGLTDSPYDHEHAGPALYNHPENFKSLFLKSPEPYNFPHFRTTVDTYADFIRATDIVRNLKARNEKAPYSAKSVIESLEDVSISKKILYIPSLKKVQGTGHLKRCAELAKETKGALFIDTENSETINFEELTKDLDPVQIVKKLPLQNEYDLIVCDMFKMTFEQAEKYCRLGKTVFLDEGSKNLNRADYVLNIIPSFHQNQKENFSNPAFIESPKNKKPSFPFSEKINKVLVCFGGEDPSHLSELFALPLLQLGFSVTVISRNEEKIKNAVPQNLQKNLTVKNFIPDLKEKLFEYDLVITHYGFTAFECVYSNTPVLLGATSRLHKKLSDRYGFCCLKKNQITKNRIKKIIANAENLKPDFCFKNQSSKNLKLSEFIKALSTSSKYCCPVCQKKDTSKDTLVERTEHHTFRQCSSCKMIYLSFSDDSETVRYEKSYFNEEYKNQYGKTYLEDFESIKKNCVSRVKNIDKITRLQKNAEKRILDIGCAYGPFLSAAKDKNWIPFGTDVCEDAVEYVNTTLGFKAVIASFTDFDFEKEFSVKNFDAVTMWYVIEHIKDLKSNLTAINRMLKPNGVFAFSTPNAYGISRRVNSRQFFTQSPKDHFSLWELKNTKKYLSRFGFKICKIVSTGIHPERIPFVKKLGISQNNFIFKVLKLVMKVLKSGDTYEVYCKKISGIKNER